MNTPILRAAIFCGCFLFAASALRAQRFTIQTGVAQETVNNGLNLFYDTTNGAFWATYSYSSAQPGAASAAFGASNAQGSYSFAANTGSAVEIFSTAFGAYSYATGYASFVAGEETYATGYDSTALGGWSYAAGDYSTALGGGSAYGRYSIATGPSQAMGDFSMAAGLSTTAKAYASLAIGRYNVGAFTDNAGTTNDGDTHWFDADPIFEIGNGTDSGHRSNILTVYKNGNTALNGSPILNLTLADARYVVQGSAANVGIGIAAPATRLDVVANPDTTVMRMRQEFWTDYYYTWKVDNAVNGALSLYGHQPGVESLALSITRDGKAGIGTTDPKEKLHVSGGGIKVSGNITVDTVSSGAFDYDTSEAQTRLFSWGTNNSTKGKFAFIQKSSAGALNATAMIIDANSNVGVGTVTPAAKLDVTGDVSVTGVIRVTAPAGDIPMLAH